jgi:hypothetical protein
MRELRLGNDFNGIIVWNSFFHLPDDQRRGLLSFDSIPPQKLLFTSRTDAGEVIGEYRGEPLYHASLRSDEYATCCTGMASPFTAHVERGCDLWILHDLACDSGMTPRKEQTRRSQRHRLNIGDGLNRILSRFVLDTTYNPIEHSAIFQATEGFP